VSDVLALLAEFGVLLVYVNVLVEQLGMPVPAIPTIIVAGAVAATGRISPLAVFAAAIGAALIADTAWYLAGRRYGHRVLALICRVSLAPDSCVRQTEMFFVRWGVGSLVVAKFVPGLSTVAPPLAGAMGLKPGAFLLFNGIGSVLWAGTAVLTGWLLSEQIDALLETLARMGTIALIAIGVLVAAYILFKWWERVRFLGRLRAARIGVEELYDLMRRGGEPVVLDVRSALVRSADGRRIPRAWPVDMDEPDVQLADIPRDREVVVYCS